MWEIVKLYDRLVAPTIIPKNCPVQQLSPLRLVRVSRINIHTLHKQIIVVTDSRHLLLVAREILSAITLQLDLSHTTVQR